MPPWNAATALGGSPMPMRLGGGVRGCPWQRDAACHLSPLLGSADGPSAGRATWCLPQSRKRTGNCPCGAGGSKGAFLLAKRGMASGPPSEEKEIRPKSKAPGNGHLMRDGPVQVRRGSHAGVAAVDAKIKPLAAGAAAEDADGHGVRDLAWGRRALCQLLSRGAGTGSLWVVRVEGSGGNAVGPARCGGMGQFGAEELLEFRALEGVPACCLGRQ